MAEASAQANENDDDDDQVIRGFWSTGPGSEGDYWKTSRAEALADEARRRQQVEDNRVRFCCYRKGSCTRAYLFLRWKLLVVVLGILCHYSINHFDLFSTAPTAVSICLCSGSAMQQSVTLPTTTTARPAWALHTNTSYRARPCTPLLAHELRTGLLAGGTSIRNVIEHLSIALSTGDGRMLCMHELMHGLPEDRRICVLHRSRTAADYVPMLNPELKGYAELDSSEIIAEHPVVCGRSIHARKRRLVVEVGFLYPMKDTNHAMRLLLDDKDEAMAFQEQWDQLRGVYNCSQ